MPPLDGDGNASRPDRIAVMAFVADAKTEADLREGLSEAVPEGFEFHRAGLRAATTMLAGIPTPRALIVDISGEDNPLVALDDLSQVVEPDVRVLVVGDRQDVNFYREITRRIGALEYLFKPLIRDVVARHFGPLLSRQTMADDLVHGGRMVTVTGARGGTGASTISTNLAWYLGVEAKRHTALVDTDIQRGVCAMMLGAKTNSGLRTALETPARVDELFLERVAQPVNERLHVLAGEEDLTERPIYTEGSAANLVRALRRRYNFVVADLPFTGHAMHHELLQMGQQRVLVMTPTLASIRDTLRLMALPNGPAQSRRAVLVLNRADMSGGLETRRVVDALKMEPDVLIPDLPRLVERAASFGLPAAEERGAFRNGIIALATEIGLSNGGAGDRVKKRGLLRWRK